MCHFSIIQMDWNYDSCVFESCLAMCMVYDLGLEPFPILCITSQKFRTFCYIIKIIVLYIDILYNTSFLKMPNSLKKIKWRVIECILIHEKWTDAHFLLLCLWNMMTVGHEIFLWPVNSWLVSIFWFIYFFMFKLDDIFIVS